MKGKRKVRREGRGLLDGQVALVTGGSTGIGRAIATLFASEGARVGVVARRDDLGCAQTVSEIEKRGGEAFYMLADLVASEQAERMIATTLDRFGTIDVLVNNAALQIRESFLKTSEENWDRVMAANVKSVFLCSRGAAAAMIRSDTGGRIINIASHAGLRYIPNTAAHYQASKAAVIHLTRVMAADLAPHSIRVNAIAPGLVETEFTRPLFADAARRRQLERLVPLGRLGHPDDIARVAVFLASNLSDWMTGETIVSNGGQTL